MILRRVSRVAAALLIALPFVSPILADGECVAAVEILDEQIEKDEWGGAAHTVDFEIRITGCAEADYTAGQITYKVVVKEAHSEDTRVEGNACDWSNEQRHTHQLSCSLTLDIGETVVGEIRQDEIYTYCYCLG